MCVITECHMWFLSALCSVVILCSSVLSPLVLLAAFHLCVFFFFFNDTAPPEISPLSLHDALPIPPSIIRNDHGRRVVGVAPRAVPEPCTIGEARPQQLVPPAEIAGKDHRTPEPPVRLEPLERRSEEHTSELQSLAYLVCRLLLEKK